MSLRLSFAFCAALASPLAAQEMTDVERQTFRAEVRAYLLENPEVLMEAIGVLESRETQNAAQADIMMVRSNVADLFEDESSYVGGNPDGDITVVEFMDYRCGYCKRAHPEVTALIAGDSNIRYILKEFPILGEQSDLASRYAIAVRMLKGDEVYKEIHDTLMEFQGDFSQESLARFSEAYGLDNDAIFALMTSPDVTEVIAANRSLGQRLNITGTPTFVMQEQLLRGYVPLNQMQQLVAQMRDDG